MKIVYIGALKFSYHCLSEVLRCNGEVVGIVTLKYSNNVSDKCDLTPISRQNNIPVHYCKNVNDKVTIQWIGNKKPDIIFCWGWSQLIKSELLNLPSKGVIGVHPTLLPSNRGRHPLIWSLVLGLKESGLTFFFMDEGEDSGPILSQKKFEISNEDTAGSLYKKIENLATIQIAEFLPLLISDNYNVIVQDSEQASYWRKRSVKDGVIDWRMNEQSILNLIRALTKPYPGATTKYRDFDITVWKAHKYNQVLPSNIEPGRIVLVSDTLTIIKCYDGAIAIDEYEPNVKLIEGEYII